jgi:hypothetical protein
MMQMNEYDSYDSDTDMDTRAEFTYDILEEFKNDSLIEKIDTFKNILSKEPQFYGINKISSQRILNFIDEDSDYNGKYFINSYQKELFEELYSAIGKKGTEKLYNKVAEQIISIVSV